MKSKFYSSGKLLLSAEYLVVDGATALAAPCKFGQDLIVSSAGSQDPTTTFTLKWTSFTVENKVWFEADFEIKNTEIEILDSSNIETANRLKYILVTALSLNPKAINQNLKIETHLEFPQNWGLGSSSTLIANIAQWFKIDALDLFFKTQKGSGYDVACATSETPIIYNRKKLPPTVNKVLFAPAFANQLFFVHLSQKQDSLKEVNRYESLVFDRESESRAFSELTIQMLKCETLTEFEKLVYVHEQRLSALLKIPTIKESRFSDYKGAIKSLGAWGGDFICITARPNFKEYFKNKGCETILSFKEMIL